MNRDIEAAIRNAMERGYKFEDVKKSLINAGYAVNEVEETAKQIGQGATSIIFPSSTLERSPKSEIRKEGIQRLNVPSSSVINSPNAPSKPFGVSPIVNQVNPLGTQINPTGAKLGQERNMGEMNSNILAQAQTKQMQQNNVPQGQFQQNQVQQNQIPRQLNNNMNINRAPIRGNYIPANTLNMMPPAPRPSNPQTQYNNFQTNPLPGGDLFPSGLVAMPKKTNMIILIIFLLMLLSAAVLGLVFKEQVITFFDNLIGGA